jgi:hypothetical protein
MIDLILSIIYGLGGLLTARIVFRVVAEEACRICPSMSIRWVDVFMAALLALIASCFWPLFAAFFLIRRAVGEADPAVFVRKVGGESRDARLARQADEIRAAERRIALLERELRIAPSNDEAPPLHRG